MFTPIKAVLVLVTSLRLGEVVCPFVSHPSGATSYINHFNNGGYSYTAPAGQRVNVRFGAQFQPAHASEVAHSLPSASNQEIFSRFGQLNPRAEGLFTPYHGFGPAETQKQVEAFNKYLKELQEEDSKEAAMSSTDFSAESHSYFLDF